MRRRFGFFLVIGAAVSLIAVSTAWACGVLATVQLDKKAANPGSTVNVTGEHYGTTNTTPVSIRLNSRSATPIATATPDGSGRINQNVVIPAGTSPGWYVILATQNRTTSGVDTGVPKSGTPGRSSLRIQGGASASRKHGGAAIAPWGSSKPTGGAGASLAVGSSSSSGGAAFLPTLLGIMFSLTLLGTGLTLVARSRRSQLGA